MEALSIQERYSQAIRSSNLTPDVNTTFSDLDVIGAMAIADRRLSTGLFNRARIGAGAVSRMVAGDSNATSDVVRVLAGRLIDSDQYDGPSVVSYVQALDIARACIAWLLHGACKRCGGRGKEPRRDAPTTHSAACPDCDGTGKMSFITHFRHEHKDAAKWLVQEMARDLGQCGAGALRALAPKKGAL